MRKNEERVNVTYSTNSKVEVVALVVGGAVAVVVLKVAVAAVVVAVEVVTLGKGRNLIDIDDINLAFYG